MTKEEKAIREFCGQHADWWPSITQVQEMLALAQPEQKYHRGARLICLETEEYCVIHISCTDRQWVKFPDSHIGVYTNEQVAELFELLPKEPEQEPVGQLLEDAFGRGQVMWFNKPKDESMLYTTPPQHESTCAECDKNQSDGWALYCVDCLREFYKHDPTNKRKWVGLTQTQVKLLWEGVREEAIKSGDSLNWVFYTHINEALKEKNTREEE